LLIKSIIIGDASQAGTCAEYIFGKGSKSAGQQCAANKVTQINISDTMSATIDTVGGSIQMFAQVLPATATNKAISWSVSNTNIATISSSGLLTATGNANGNVIVTATAQDGGGTTGTEIVAITNQVALQINYEDATSKTPTVGDQIRFSASNATSGIMWSSSDTLIATIDSTGGLLTAKAVGTVVVKASMTDGSFLPTTDTLIITAKSILVTSISISGAAGATTITTNGGTLQMSATVLPAGATDNAVIWSVSGGAATISTTGLLTATANGTATVTATAHDGSKITGSSNIVVSNQSTTVVPVTTITVTSTSATLVTVGATATVTVNVLPTIATNQAVAWTSSDPTVATVTSTGVVTAAKNGTVTITATATDGSSVTGTTTVVVDIASGVNIVSSKALTIAPNPAGEVLKIFVDAQVKQVDILNTLGVVVSSTVGQTSISLADLTKGIYIARVTTADGSILVKTFVKK